MERIIAATAVCVIAYAAQAQTPPTVRNLIQQGYEVKAYDSSNAKLYLQKGTSLYLCSVVPPSGGSKGYATSAADVANASCAAVN